MSLSWNFPAQAEPIYEGSERSRSGALQFSSWNRADNTDNMYVKKLQTFTPTYELQSNFQIFYQYHDHNPL